MTDPSSSLEYLLSRLDASPDPQFVDSLETALVNSFADLESRRAYIETAVHPTDSEKSAIISLLKDRFPQVLGTSFSSTPGLLVDWLSKSETNGWTILWPPSWPICKKALYDQTFIRTDPGNYYQDFRLQVTKRAHCRRPGHLQYRRHSQSFGPKPGGLHGHRAVSRSAPRRSHKLRGKGGRHSGPRR